MVVSRLKVSLGLQLSHKHLLQLLILDLVLETQVLLPNSPLHLFLGLHLLELQVHLLGLQVHLLLMLHLLRVSLVRLRLLHLQPLLLLPNQPRYSEHLDLDLLHLLEELLQISPNLAFSEVVLLLPPIPIQPLLPLNLHYLVQHQHHRLLQLPPPLQLYRLLVCLEQNL